MKVRTQEQVDELAKALREETGRYHLETRRINPFTAEWDELNVEQKARWVRLATVALEWRLDPCPRGGAHDMTTLAGTQAQDAVEVCRKCGETR